MKLVLVIVIIVCFLFLGYGLSKYYIERKRFFSEFELFLSNLNSSISFGREKLLDIIEKNNQYKSETLSKLCDNYATALKNKMPVDDKIFDGISTLKNDEKQLFISFFSMLGKYDVYSQNKEINSYSVKFSELYQYANEDCKKYASLIIKLTVIAGLLVCLLII